MLVIAKKSHSIGQIVNQMENFPPRLDWNHVPQHDKANHITLQFLYNLDV